MAQKQKSISLAIFSLLLMYLAESLVAEVLQTWCVAKPSSNDSVLQSNMGFSCAYVQADCNAIKEGSTNPCFNPDTPIHHASFAMNAYYQKKGRNSQNCNFANSGLVSITNPSSGDCIYKGGDTLMDLSSAGKWCVATPWASTDMLQTGIDYACSHVDCSITKSGGPCYEPDDLSSHASVAFNLYYQATGKLYSSCNFSGAALVVVTDPSYANCKFEFRK